MAQVSERRFGQLRESMLGQGALGEAESAGGATQSCAKGLPRWFEALCTQGDHTWHTVGRRLRIGQVPRGVLVSIAVLSALALVLGAVLALQSGSARVVYHDRDEALAQQAPGQQDAGSLPSADGAAPETLLRVHVTGAVVAPGVYALAADARVCDAIAAAGGVAPDAAPDAINLAAPVGDGSRIVVPTTTEVEQGTYSQRTPYAQADAATYGADASLININTASASQLEELPGIGPALASAIVDDRRAYGDFGSVDDLLRVSGIGDRRLEALRGLVCV